MGKPNRLRSIAIDDSSEDELDINSSAQMWAQHGNMYFGCEKAVDSLPHSQYIIGHSQSHGIFLRETSGNFDTLINLPDASSEKVLQEIDSFLQRQDVYKDFDMIWKRGVMLYGPPGSGKTSCVQQVSKQIIESGGISIFLDNPSLGAEGLALIRRIEPDRTLLVIMEDLDAIVSKHGESELLSLLDGETQVDNVVFIATTNYPERLDKRIVNRPSRFDIVQRVDMPSEQARRAYIDYKVPELKTKVASEDANSTAKSELDRIRAAVTKQVNELESLKASIDSNVSETDSVRISTNIKDLEKSIEKLNSDLKIKLQNYNDSLKVTTELDVWVEKTKGFSVAHIKELILSVFVFNRSFEKSIKRLSYMLEMDLSKSTNNSDLGL